jgi:hypothetical protein
MVTNVNTREGAIRIVTGRVQHKEYRLIFAPQQTRRENRISYEGCLPTALREKVRCKEAWVEAAHRFRSPDEKLPQDFDIRRGE